MQGRAGEEQLKRRERKKKKKEQLNRHIFILSRRRNKRFTPPEKSIQTSNGGQHGCLSSYHHVLRREIGSIQAVHGQQNFLPWFHLSLSFSFRRVTVSPPHFRSIGKV